MTETIRLGTVAGVRGALPNLVIIGAMKCGTTALHNLLDDHPAIEMAKRKELNFFFGPASSAGDGTVSTWHRGVEWYASQFDPGAAVRGESSPGYTSPDHPEAAGRMATVIPDARLVYLVRDPVDRAVSQYRHHYADGTETRSVAAALLDPRSHYMSRGRYVERLEPFLQHFPRERIAIVAQEQLLRDPYRMLERLYGFLDIDPPALRASPVGRWNVSSTPHVGLPEKLRARLSDLFRDDVARLRELTGHDFAHWSL